MEKLVGQGARHAPFQCPVHDAHPQGRTHHASREYPFRAQAALEDYNKAADLKAKVRVLDGIKMEAVMAEPDAVNALIRAVDADVRNGGSLALQQVLELAVLRDDLIASLKNTEAAKEAYPLRSIVEANIGDVGRFAEVLNSMPAVRQKRVYASLPPSLGRIGRRRRWSF